MNGHRNFLFMLCMTINIVCHAQPDCHIRNFTLRDGLAANNISGIEQSHNGLIWIATWNGLCCYDGYQFTTFRSDSWEDDNTLSTNRIAMIQPDSQERIWVRTYDDGLYLLDTYQCRFINVGLLIEHKYKKHIVPRNMYSIPSGHTWITDGQHGELNLRIDDRYPTDVERIEVINMKQHPSAGQYIKKVVADAKGQEWIITDKGMFRYGTWNLKPIASGTDTTDQQDTAFANRMTACGLQASDYEKHFTDRQGNLWLSSIHGLTMVSIPNHQMQWHPLVADQQTRSVLCRRDGTVWAGSQDGFIGIYSAEGVQRGWLTVQGRIVTEKTRFANRIYVMKEDSQGNTWIGTKGEGLYVISRQGSVTHYLPDAANRFSLNHANIYDIDEDEQGNIWIATYGGGLNLAHRTQEGSFRFLNNNNELTDYPIGQFGRIRRITHTKQGVILLACTTGMVTFSNAKVGRQQGIPNHGKRFYHSQHNRQDTTSLYTSDVMQALVTNDGDVFVATSGGGVQRLTSTDLLSDNLHFQKIDGLKRVKGNVLSMVEGRRGGIWIAHEAEVCKYSPKTRQVERFSPNIMGEHNELTEAQLTIDSRGRIWIAATGGLLMYDTKQIHKSHFRPNIIFTNLLYQGERESHPILNRQTLTIPTDKRNLTISFAALDYGDNYLMEYAYRMDGDKEWNYIGATPRISFSQLPPGHHTLLVKSTNSDGVWTDNITTLHLDVTPTFWELTWVRIVLLLLVIFLTTTAVLTYLKHRQRNREREQRLENILRQYRELQQVVAEQVSAETPVSPTVDEPHHYTLKEPTIVDADEEMMQQLMKFIEERISDDSLKIEEMAEAVNLGRSVFYEKVKSLVGMSPIDFLRRLRMQRAEQLIARSSMNVSEIAYAVGYTDPKYFSRCFKKETGLTPREYREKKAQSTT